MQFISGTPQELDQGSMTKVVAYQIIFGETANHLMLIVLSTKPYTGKDADAALGDAYIFANKNSVPNATRVRLSSRQGCALAHRP